MKLAKKRFITVLCSAYCLLLYPMHDLCPKNYRHLPPGKTKPGAMVFSIAQDMVGINYNIISFSTFKIVTTIFPFVLAARMADGRLQNCFYDRHHHKNINQLDDACRMFAKHSLIFPFFFAGVLSLGAHDEDLMTTSRMFVKGLPFVMLMSNLIKKFDVHIVGEGCLRPWNEHFSRKQRARGGFPSGHMATMAYATTLYGIRFGPKWAVPFGIITAAVGVSFLNCNRHYLSQILAGLGLGAIYGAAASKQVDFRLDKQAQARACLGFDFNEQGCPALKVGVSF